MVRKLAATLLLLVGAGTAAAQDVMYRTVIASFWRAQCIACHGAQAPERAGFLLDEKGYAAR